MELDGIYGGKLRRLTPDVFAITDEQTSGLLPFAQKDMVITFMNGIDQQLQVALDASLEELLAKLPGDLIAKQLGLTTQQKKKLDIILQAVGNVTLDMFRKRAAQYQQRVHIDPVTTALSHLPKEELAELAESLVHLTSLKRRVALNTETVGGPIDVACISKGDGFIWLKRKHYFRPELNPYFISTYYTKDDR